MKINEQYLEENRRRIKASDELLIQLLCVHCGEEVQASPFAGHPVCSSCEERGKAEWEAKQAKALAARRQAETYDDWMAGSI